MHDPNGLKEFRRTLPIFHKRDLIIDAIRASQVVLISGDTGCGKTTQVPQYILEEFELTEQLIGVTQPRRIAAMTLCQRVSDELNTDVGYTCGYEIRFESAITDYTKIKFMTDGVLLREMSLDPLLTRYKFLVIDEAHERGLNSDILLGLIKWTLPQRPDLKVVVMSATLETTKIFNFFERGRAVEVKGRFHPIEIYNTDEPVKDYVDGCLNSVLQIHLTERPGDILVFLTGQEEIEDIANLLKQKIEDHPAELGNLIICPLYAAMPPEAQLQAFNKTPPGKRKVVLSTNIAETSVTIDGTVFVVDSGFMKMKLYDPDKNIESLVTVPISKSGSIQRAGRAGRQQPGKCYRLFPKEAFDSLDQFIVAEILRTDLTAVILKLKAIGVKNAYNFPFIDKPEDFRIKSALEDLKILGALDEQEELTTKGKEMVELPLDPLYASALLDCIECIPMIREDMLSVISILNIENLLFVPRNTTQTKLQAQVNKYKIPCSDHLTKLNLFQSYLAAKNKQEFCQQMNVNRRNINKVIAVRQQLRGILEEIMCRRRGEDRSMGAHITKVNLRNFDVQDLIKEVPEKHDLDIQALTTMLGKAFKLNTATLSEDGSYTLAKSKEKVFIHPESVLFTKKDKPKFIIYNSVVTTKKTYLRDVSEVVPFSSK